MNAKASASGLSHRAAGWLPEHQPDQLRAQVRHEPTVDQRGGCIAREEMRGQRENDVRLVERRRAPLVAQVIRVCGPQQRPRRSTRPHVGGNQLGDAAGPRSKARGEHANVERNRDGEVAGALSMISHEGYAKAVRGRGHIVRRKRSRLTLPSRLYSSADPDPSVPMELHQLDVYQEHPPDNIALPLETGSEMLVWVRRAVFIAADDRQPIQIHVSWIPGLTSQAEDAIRDVSQHIPWPEAVQEITGRTIASVLQHTRARRANPFEADAFGIPDATAVFVAHATTYDAKRRPIEHSRYTWPTDAVRISDYYTYSRRA
jgi:DNA-binding GntR family transcriptional regulator